MEMVNGLMVNDKWLILNGQWLSICHPGLEPGSMLLLCLCLLDPASSAG